MSDISVNSNDSDDSDCSNDFDDSDEELFVDFSSFSDNEKTYDNLYEKESKYFDDMTTKFYKVIREQQTSVITQDDKNFSPNKSFQFPYTWDPYTGERSEKDPYGPLCFHPDDLIYYFYINRLNKLWMEPQDDNGGYYQGMYDDAVGSGEDINIVGRGTYSELYLFRLPINNCYLPQDHDMSIITMGPMLTWDEIVKIDNLANKVYKNNFKIQFGINRPSLTRMFNSYTQALNKTPNIDMKLYQYNSLSDISEERLKELRDKANRDAVDSLRNM
jgi:hypothetical protein